ncbi:hypothetical protein Mapa_011309 [Marchantia paleacea]|nr:hypothetical protein Mapa_011309 [Marchantia paleacea]
MRECNFRFLPLGPNYDICILLVLVHSVARNLDRLSHPCLLSIHKLRCRSSSFSTWPFAYSDGILWNIELTWPACFLSLDRSRRLLLLGLLLALGSAIVSFDLGFLDDSTQALVTQQVDGLLLGLVLRIEIGSLLHQEFHELGVAALNGEVQRRHPLPVPGIHIRPGQEEGTNHFRVPLLAGKMNGRHVILSCCPHIRSGLAQHLHHLCTPRPRCHMEPG